MVELAARHLRAMKRELAELQAFHDALRSYVRHWKWTMNPDACAAAQLCNLIENSEIESAPAKDPSGRWTHRKRQKAE